MDSHHTFPISAHVVSGSGSCFRVEIEYMVEPIKETTGNASKYTTENQLIPCHKKSVLSEAHQEGLAVLLPGLA